MGPISTTTVSSSPKQVPFGGQSTLQLSPFWASPTGPITDRAITQQSITCRLPRSTPVRFLGLTTRRILEAEGNIWAHRNDSGSQSSPRRDGPHETYRTLRAKLNQRGLTPSSA